MGMKKFAGIAAEDSTLEKVEIPSRERTWNPTLTSNRTTLGWGTRREVGGDF